MKKIFFATLIFLSAYDAHAQNVGIGTSIPLMKLHITKSDSAVALLENTQTLNIGVKTALYFKTGSGPYPFTGAVKTTGEGTAAARLGLFSYASTSANQLLERLSINDVGNVGIGTITPTAKLEVSGNTLINGSSTVNGDATVNGDLKITGGFVLPLKIVTGNVYNILPADYTIVVDMQNDPNKWMQVYLPTSAAIGRVLKIVAVNMAQKSTNPKVPTAPYPYNGTVSIYNNTMNLTYPFQSLSYYFVNQLNVVSNNGIAYRDGDYEETKACSFQYAGSTVGWVITDVKSEKYGGVYYIF